jgi:outer membrane protein TolC
VLTGQAPLALDGLLADSVAVPQPAQDLALAIPAETLRQRPDVRAAEERIAAALARVSQADAARYPDFRISGNLGLRALTRWGPLPTALHRQRLAGQCVDAAVRWWRGACPGALQEAAWSRPVWAMRLRCSRR